MTLEEKECRNIPQGYYEDSDVSEAKKTRCNREREEYMSKKVLAEAGQADSVLVICGRIHAEAIAAQLSPLGHSVEKTDLQDQDWYLENWFDHMLNL